jgi:spermidine synthase
MLGVVSQIGQVLLLRELLMVFHGNEFSIGLILAAWLAWVGVGSRLGAALADRTRRPLFLLTLSAAGVLLALPATILLIRVLRGFFDVLPGAYLSLPDMTVSCFLLVAPVCLLLGAQFVLLSRVWRESDRAADTSSAGKTYLGEAAGNMAGGILFTFLMVRYLNSLQSAILAGMLMLAAYLLVPRKLEIDARGSSARFRPVLLGLLALGALAFGFSELADSWAYRLQWQHFAPQHELVEIHQSKHGTISVMRREDQYSFFQSGHLIFTTAGPEAAAPGLEEQEAAVLAHLSMVQHEKPERVLLIGGGLRGTLSEIIKHPVERVDYIELDEVLTDAAKPYVSRTTLEALADPRVRLIHADGRLFVKAAEERYDMIVVDVPDPATAVLNRYYTLEFFREAKALLHPDGVFVIGATSTPDLRGTALANRNTMIYHTLRAVFSRVLVAGERRMLFFAANAPERVSVDVPTLQMRYRERNIESDSFSHHHYQVLLQEAQLRRVNWIVRNHGRSSDAHRQGPGPVPLHLAAVAEQESAEAKLPPVEGRYFVNSDLKPIGYSYTLMFWDDRARTGRRETFRWLLHFELWWILPLVCMPLLAVLGARIAGRRSGRWPDTHFAVLFAVFATGLSIMALQIALLFSFQSVYGFVYEMVGLIVAIFMGGLALGTLLAHRCVADKANMRTLAGVQLLIALLGSLIAVVLPVVAAVPSPATVFVLFSALTFVAGLANGVGFPLSAACYMALTRRAERSAGIVYGVELAGACLGAILASAVAAPMVGIVICCLLAAAANATAMAVLLISRRSYARGEGSR